MVVFTLRASDISSFSDWGSYLGHLSDFSFATEPGFGVGLPSFDNEPQPTLYSLIYQFMTYWEPALNQALSKHGEYKA